MPLQGLVKRLRKCLRLAAVAWLTTSPCLTIDKMEISMDVNVTLKVHGETGVGVGPGLVKRGATQTALS